LIGVILHGIEFVSQEYVCLIGLGRVACERHEVRGDQRSLDIVESFAVFWNLGIAELMHGRSDILELEDEIMLVIDPPTLDQIG